MKRLMIVESVLAASVALAADTSYKGADGGDITDPANWNGAAPQYDADTNPNTPLYFGKTSPAPGATYGVTMSKDMISKSMYFDKPTSQSSKPGLNLDIDLAGHSLKLLSGMVFDSMWARWSSTCDGNHIVVHDGSLTSSVSFANNGNNLVGNRSSLVLNNVKGSGTFSILTKRSSVVLTNGTVWTGGYSTSDGAYDNSFGLVTGPGTVLNLNGSTLQTNGRFNSHQNNCLSNDFVIADHAVVTNGYRVWVTGVGGVLKVLDGAWLQCSDYIRYEGWGKGTLFQMTNGSRCDCGYADFARYGRNNVVDISGKGTVFSCNQAPANQRIFLFAYQSDSSDNKFWLHDGAIVTNAYTAKGSTANFGYDSTTHRNSVIIEGGSSFYMTSDIGVGTDGGTLYDTRIDTGAWIEGYRMRIGQAGTAQTNTLFVGSEASFRARDWIELRSGDANTLTISNGTLQALNNYISIGAGWNVTFAGRKPRLVSLTPMLSATSMTFDIPVEGYEPDAPVIEKTSASQGLTINWVPTFKMRQFARKTGGTLTLAKGAQSLTISDAVLAQWQAAAEAGAGDCAKCKVYVEDKKLKLYVKPLKGLTIFLR